MTLFVSRYNQVAVVLYLFFSIIGYFMVFDSGYSVLTNSISDLSAQGLNNNWVMQLGFALFGVTMFTGATIKLLNNKGVFIVEVFMMMFAFTHILASLFSVQPFVKDVSYSEIESNVHIVSLLIGNALLMLSIFLHAYLDKVKSRQKLHVFFLAIIFSLFLLSNVLSDYHGALDKTYVLISLIWISLIYNKSGSLKKI